MLAQSQFVHSEDVPSIEAIMAFRAGMQPFWHPVVESACSAMHVR